MNIFNVDIKNQPDYVLELWYGKICADLLKEIKDIVYVEINYINNDSISFKNSKGITKFEYLLYSKDYCFDWYVLDRFCLKHNIDIITLGNIYDELLNNIINKDITPFNKYELNG